MIDASTPFWRVILWGFLSVVVLNVAGAVAEVINIPIKRVAAYASTMVMGTTLSALIALVIGKLIWASATQPIFLVLTGIWLLFGFLSTASSGQK